MIGSYGLGFIMVGFVYNKFVRKKIYLKKTNVRNRKFIGGGYYIKSVIHGLWFQFLL